MVLHAGAWTEEGDQAAITEYTPMKKFIAPALIASLLIGALTPAAQAQLRVVNYNVARLNGNQAALQAVFVALNNDDKPGFAVAPHVYAFQEMGSADAAPLLAMLNTVAPPGVTYALGTFTINTPPNTSESSSAGAQAMYYRSDMLVEEVAGHVDISTGAGRNADRWKLRLIDYDSPAATFYIYSCHLKASPNSSDAAQRLSGATAVRSNADSLPAGTHIIYTGDWNVYHNLESAYLKFLSTPGNGQSFDPLGTGSWAGAGNAIKHTQAPCRNGCSLVAGGMDDRFDHQHITAAFNDGEGLALIPGTCRALGNDGNHYDTDINAGNNTYYPLDIPRSNALATNLKTASDHVPVVVDYQLPAVLSASFSCDCGRVIVGAAVNAEVQVGNVAQAITAAGADELDYEIEGSGILSGSATGVIPALDPAEIVPLVLDTSTVGLFAGSVDVTSASQAAQVLDPDFNMETRVLRPASASFDNTSEVNAKLISQSLQANSGVHPLPVEIFNLGHDEDQATLDIDGVTGVAAPFGGGSPTLTSGIGPVSSTIDFSFDTTGLAPGTYESLVQIDVSDEDIPGEASDSLMLTLVVMVPGGNADVDCDDDVDMDDVDAFAQVLVDLDTEPCHVERSDFDGSASANGADIPLFIQAFLNP
ncbi:MAG: hypothetical protein HS101_10390 [Planctomycetia bacterium]|nr:hypothetical protein [Planctomycetia bacterium]MCC7315095.1 hypothetical protein [Planctomycetota bacterium]OQZ07024.1 MAG: hypothetical protein B6D36_02015 [Planctomycetes bacterium UTPLA1]